MIKDNKGFAITEVLILSTVIIGLLVFMYAQFKTINRGYQYSFKYDTVEGMYLANNIVNYINDGNYDKLVELLNNTQNGYIDITECTIENSNLISFCQSLYQKSEIEKIIFTEENLIKLKQNMNDFDNDLKNYINQIKTTNEQNDYRIIVKYNNGTFATMRFNKGNSYVEEGLIAHLDGINNTGSGHSTETQIWKDLSNHGNDATLYNNPTWSNNSLTFDGIDDYGVLDNTANQEFPNGVTIETRVKILSLEGKGFENLNYIMFLDNVYAGSSLHKGISQYISKTNRYFNSRISINGYTIVHGLQKELETYYTVTTVYDNNSIKLYVDGIFEEKTDMEAQTIYSKSRYPFNIARRINGEIDPGYPNVEFQNVLIYDRALTENEIMRNYQADMARY